MKVLLVTYLFPPYNAIGSIRTGKLARFLAQQGHEVRVLTADEQPLPKSLDVEIDPAAVIYTPWFNVNFLPELFFGGSKQVSSKGYSTKSSSLKKLGLYYRVLLNLPDERIGWLPHAVLAGRKLLRSWMPDLIYASMPPATSLLVAARLSRISGTPWVAELRDPWADNANNDYPRWRLTIDNWIENATLHSATGLVTVSPPWGELLKARFHLPTAVVMNGYAPEDLPDPDAVEPAETDTLRLVYTGTYYPQLHDISPLFAALRQMGELGRKVRVVFYSRYIDAVQALAEQEGVGWAVEHHALVPYHQSLRIQQGADLLLYLIPNQQGFIPAKLFEYLAARRPVLAVGPPDSQPGSLICERNAGLVSNAPDEIAPWLQAQIEAKARLGRLPALPASVVTGLSRDEQFARLEQFLLGLPLTRVR